MKGTTMRVRTLLASAVAALGLASAAHASTLFVTLNPVDTGATVTLNGLTAHVYNIEVWAKTDQGETQAGNGDGGIRGFQFDILSNSNHTPTDATAVPESGVPSTKAKITFNVPGFSTITPNKTDATASNGYPLDTDTDQDAIGASISDPGVSSNDFILGQSGHANYNAVLGNKVATEVWDIVPPPAGSNETLNLFVKGGTYYDFSPTGQANNSQGTFANTTTTNAVIGTTPEPASFSMLALGGLAIVRRRRA
jgi:hypothetical protein